MDQDGVIALVKGVTYLVAGDIMARILHSALFLPPFEVSVSVRDYEK
jgi:hypothetical protein